MSLSDLYNGAVKEFTINKNIICPVCRGTGAKVIIINTENLILGWEIKNM